MSKTNISTTALDDLSYVRSLAEEGRHAPLISGRIGLMWGVLLSITLLIHGLAAYGLAGFSIEYIGVLWLAFGVTGGILTAILRRTLKDKPGKSAINNRVEKAVWSASAIVIFTIAISIAISVAKNGHPYWLFDIIMAIAFGSHAINYYVLSKITGASALMVPSFIALTLCALMIIMLGSPAVYFIAAIGVVFTIILPSVSDIRKEPKNVV